MLFCPGVLLRAAAALPGGKCDEVWLGGQMNPLLLVSFCLTTSFHFPLMFSLVLPRVTNCVDVRSGQSRESWLAAVQLLLRLSVAVFFEGQPPWEHGALCNVSKYSFRLTPFLPLSDPAVRPSLLLNLGYEEPAASELQSPRSLLQSRRSESLHCWESEPAHLQPVCPVIYRSKTTGRRWE